MLKIHRTENLILKKFIIGNEKSLSILVNQIKMGQIATLGVGWNLA